MKIRPVGAEFFHAEGQKDRRTDGRTDLRTNEQQTSADMTKAFFFFCNFENAPKKNNKIIGTQ